ncbi:MAG: pantoate--beta-alanine ligase [Planctomycetota bacterium]
MERLKDPAAAHAWCTAARNSGRSIGFVPTMGALHEGHLELVRRAVAEQDLCVVSVFVNPLQFDEQSDFDRYPRDFDADAALLDRAGCAMAFTGTLEGFFPGASGIDGVPREDPGPAAVGLEGDQRPGHFEGVATIVRRLFEVVQPSCAYFGEKDFQQTLVVRSVARRLGFPRIVVCPTSRDSDGLARSSRNARLGLHARERALLLSRALHGAAAAWAQGQHTAGALRTRLSTDLADFGGDLEYAEVRDPDNFAHVPSDVERLERAQALVAARVDGVRLIDNLRLDGGTP